MFKITYYKICFLSSELDPGYLQHLTGRRNDLDVGYPRPLHLAGRHNDSNLHSSSDSLESAGSSHSGPSVVSIAGQVNRRLGHLLGYQDMSSSAQIVGSGTANITGYEIVCNGDKQKYTVSIHLFTIMKVKHKAMNN